MAAHCLQWLVLTEDSPTPTRPSQRPPAAAGLSATGCTRTSRTTRTARRITAELLCWRMTSHRLLSCLRCACNLLLLCSLLVASPAAALNNGLARTPQMGWNSWNSFHCDVNETNIRDAARVIHESGLQAAGYEFVNIDDCWGTTRDAQGRQQFDPRTFPSGAFSLTGYIHSLGLKAGIYSDAGTNTCAGRPGSLDHEVMDALSFAAWGFDYLKYDHCNSLDRPDAAAYTAMRDALNATGRPIVFSLCDGWPEAVAAQWAGPIGNSWRTTWDINPSFASVIHNVVTSDAVWQYGQPGAWNDPDMLEVGNGMSYDEDVAHFSLWCLVKSPLVMGHVLTSMSAATLSILSNQELIALNQDELGVQARRVRSLNDTLDVWAGPLADGSVAVLLLNRGEQAADITARWLDIGLPDATTASVRDLWQHADLGVYAGLYTAAAVRPHASVTLRLQPVNSPKTAS